MTTKSKKKWNPTTVLAHVDSVLAANANLHMQLNAANRLVATNADAVNHWKAAHSRHEVEIRALKAQLRAADETAGKALADAKRARDSQGVVWLVRFTPPSGLPYISFVAATKDDALLKVSRIYLKTKVLDQGARVQVVNNDAEGAFAGEYIIQQAKIVNPG